VGRWAREAGSVGGGLAGHIHSCQHGSTAKECVQQATRWVDRQALGGGGHAQSNTADVGTVV
jgi:hypothetical protein